MSVMACHENQPHEPLTRILAFLVVVGHRMLGYKEEVLKLPGRTGHCHHPPEIETLNILAGCA
jgi:hypothetical protein